MGGCSAAQAMVELERTVGVVSVSEGWSIS